MQILNEFRRATRRLFKEPGFTVIAVATLALGIGLNTAVFSWIDAALLAPPPIGDPDTLVHFYTAEDDTFLQHGPLAFPDFEDIAARTESFESAAAYTFTRVALEVDGEVDLVLSEQVSGNYFQVLDVPTVLGRPLVASDDAKDAPQPVVVLAHSTWEKRFGSDPGAIGATLRVNGHPCTVVGVANPEFTGMTKGFAPELWFPIRMSRVFKTGTSMNSGKATPGLDKLDDRGTRWHFGVARLSDGATLESSQAEIDTLASQLEAEYPKSNEERTFSLVPSRQVRILPGVDQAITAASVVVLALVGLVLLIACATLANMQLVRALSRGKEIATRLALGASRLQLVGQLLVEALVLAALGGTLGLLLAGLSTDALSFFGVVLPPELGIEPQVDLRVVLFGLGAATFTALAFGLLPAWQVTRTGLSQTLRDATRGTTGGRSKARLRKGLVVVEVAFSLMLLICAGLSIRSLQAAHRVDPGFETSGAAVARFAPTLQGYSDERTAEFYDQIVERLQANPDVTAASTASHLPLTLNISSNQVAGADTKLEADDWPFADSSNVGIGYFEAMQIPILRGRAFDTSDRADSAPVVIVNQALADSLWPEGDAVGQVLRIDDREEAFTVIGVASTGRYRTLGESPRPYYYHPLTQEAASSRTVIVRSRSGDPSPLLEALRTTARGLDSDLAISGLESLEDAIGMALVLPRVGAGLFGAFGVVGLLLATLGLYGVISTSVAQRRQEIGIRMALGAGGLSVAKMVTRDGLKLGGLGIAVGLVGAVAGTRVLSSVLIGIDATDPLTFGGVALGLLAIALVASLVPARRASRVDPMIALRAE